MQKRLRLGKRTLAIVLTLVMVLGLTSLMASAADYDNHWAKEYIDAARENGWMIGDEAGNFNPDASITRAEFAVMLWRAMGEPDAAEPNPFTDVSAGDWYAEATAVLSESGITNGIGDGLFGPAGTLTREMGVTMLARAFNLETEDVSDDVQFADSGSISDWAGASVSAMVELGYVSGVGGNMFAPQTALKRGEMAKLLTVVYEGEGGISSIVIKLSQDPTVSTSGSVTITAEVTSRGGTVTYIGSRKSNEDASYTDKTGFDEITTEPKFTVSANGWYAVCAEDSTGAFAYKLIQITNISSGSTGGVPGGNNDVDVTGVKITDASGEERTEYTFTLGGIETAFQLTAKLDPSNANKNNTVKWTIDDDTIADIGNDTALTAAIAPKKAGTAIITVETANGKTATCELTVVAKDGVQRTVVATADPSVVIGNKAYVMVTIDDFDSDAYYIVKYGDEDMDMLKPGVYGLQVIALGGEVESGFEFHADHDEMVDVKAVKAEYKVEATEKGKSSVENVLVRVTITNDGDYSYKVTYSGVDMNKSSDTVYWAEVLALGVKGQDWVEIDTDHQHYENIKVTIIG